MGKKQLAGKGSRGGYVVPNALLTCIAPDGAELQLAEQVVHEKETSFEKHDTAAISAFYLAHGYVVVRGLIPRDLCSAARQAFEGELKPFDGLWYRQPSSGAAEKHNFSEFGYMLNSILNFQDLDPVKFGAFKKAGLDIVTHDAMHEVVRAILAEDATIVQTMCFEGNPETWPHQDTYYLDSSRLGSMVAAWFALEDIDAGSGRFFVYPNSHKIEMTKNSGEIDIAFNHKRYKQLVIDVIKQENLECHAPALAAGDVLFWNSKTIHGSLKTLRPEKSRASFTTHYVPVSTGLMQFQKRDMHLKLRQIGKFKVHSPKDQTVLKNRLLLELESVNPQAFQYLKRLAIKMLVR